MLPALSTGAWLFVFAIIGESDIQPDSGTTKAFVRRVLPRVERSLFNSFLALLGTVKNPETDKTVGKVMIVATCFFIAVSFPFSRVGRGECFSSPLARPPLGQGPHVSSAKADHFPFSQGYASTWGLASLISIFAAKRDDAKADLTLFCLFFLSPSLTQTRSMDCNRRDVSPENAIQEYVTPYSTN